MSSQISDLGVLSAKKVLKLVLKDNTLAAPAIQQLGTRAGSNYKLTEAMNAIAEIGYIVPDMAEPAIDMLKTRSRSYDALSGIAEIGCRVSGMEQFAFEALRQTRYSGTCRALERLAKKFPYMADKILDVLSVQHDSVRYRIMGEIAKSRRDMVPKVLDLLREHVNERVPTYFGHRSPADVLTDIGSHYGIGGPTARKIADILEQGLQSNPSFIILKDQFADVANLPAYRLMLFFNSIVNGTIPAPPQIQPDRLEHMVGIVNAIVELR